MKVRAKLCGLTTQDDIDAAATAGAAYIGLVFFEKSPRNVTIETARGLARHAPVGLAKVALVVNADDAALDRITASVPLDMLQLHGTESSGARGGRESALWLAGDEGPGNSIARRCRPRAALFRRGRSTAFGCQTGAGRSVAGGQWSVFRLATA